mgnify:CR=1 FL=1
MLNRVVKSGKKLVSMGPAAFFAMRKKQGAMAKTFGGREWHAANDGLSQRSYDSYEEYVTHQATKLDVLLTKYDDKKRAETIVNFSARLKERLGDVECVKPGKSVLCLAARLGGECLAFIESGCFALGIDLNPGPDNRFVVTGDFHRLQYADGSVDIVFTNSLDHCFEMEKVIAEANRVLKSGGNFIVEVARGMQDEAGRDHGLYEATWWESSDSVMDVIEKGGFKKVEVRPFKTNDDVSWDTVIFEKE